MLQHLSQPWASAGLPLPGFFPRRHPSHASPGLGWPGLGQELCILLESQEGVGTLVP